LLKTQLILVGEDISHYKCHRRNNCPVLVLLPQQISSNNPFLQTPTFVRQPSPAPSAAETHATTVNDSGASIFDYWASRHKVAVRLWDHLKGVVFNKINLSRGRGDSLRRVS